MPFFILHPSAFILALHPSAFILPPSSFRLHPCSSSFRLHPSAFILPPSSLLSLTRLAQIEHDLPFRPSR
ncbi:MAG: hypothetical protein ACT4PQ_06925, partial [Betaproteobacteria bacterium]